MSAVGSTTTSVVSGPAGWGLVVMAASLLLFVALSVAAYLLLFRERNRPGDHGRAARRLADQWARGQITAPEYRRLAIALKASRHGSARRRGRRRTGRR